jgi:membrane-associated phospholipid phosphatase
MIDRLVSVPLASVTGVLRIRADKHYATDVLAGFLGAAHRSAGSFPALRRDHERRRASSATLTKSRLTWGFSRTWVW